jgi:hypothetical protein
MKQPAGLLVTALLATVLALIGCGRGIDGSAAMGSRDVDPSYFFSGEVPIYGQRVAANDLTTLAYLRAIRRIDPCGLLTRESLAKIGEIGSVGTLFALDECDIDIKVPGETDRRYASIEVILDRHSGQSVAFLAGDLPAYESFPGSCNYLLPLNLSLLPGAQPLRSPGQPFVRVGLIGEEDCDFARRLVRAVAPRLGSLQLPVRDAVATYPAALAERDPCQVLSVLGGEVDHWDIGRSRPYECNFAVKRRGDVVPVQVSLEPQLFDMAAETRERRNRDGVEIFVDQPHFSAPRCSASCWVVTTSARARSSSGPR